MTRLLVGLTGGLYRFDLDAGGSPRPGCFPASSLWHSPWTLESLRECTALPTTGDFGTVRMRVRRGCPSEPPQGFFKGPAGGAIQPRETTFVSVDPVPQADGRREA